MTIEIISTNLNPSTKIVTIEAVDCSEESLMRIERRRMDGFERTFTYVFDTMDPITQKYLYNYLKKQKASKNAATWGQALRALIGQVIQSPAAKYRIWE